MVQQTSQQRGVWIAAGLLGGLCISYFWPHEPVMSATSDRAAKFGMLTVPVQPSIAGISGELEGVFVLDYLTGRLTGAILDAKSGKFAYGYFRNVAADFNVNPNVDATYAMVAGGNQLQAKGGVPLASGVIYVGELSSGKIIGYSFPYAATRSAVGPIQMQPVDGFPFRQEAKGK